MGVVRDVTVDNLVTAVGNIDTSTLAQDSTLQDVVTAIGNISGGSDPVTNTTVNSLCKDTTGQSIASAISGLGTTLGSDRALIDGSNIANPSAFRQNIGLDNTTYTNCVSILNRVAIANGGYLKQGRLCLINVSFTANTTLTNIPGILTTQSDDIPSSAFILAANDITNGINNIGESIPCGMQNNGTIYIAKIESGKSYRISGFFMI